MICVFRNRLAMRLKIAPYNLAWTPLWFLRLSDKKAVLCRPFAPPPVRAINAGNAGDGAFGGA